MSSKNLGKVAYQTYVRSITDGHQFDEADLPQFEDLHRDVQRAWGVAAVAVAYQGSQARANLEALLIGAASGAFTAFAFQGLYALLK